MTPIPLELDPNLEEVLRDIAADPRSRLFQTTPRQLALGLRGNIPKISSRQAALTAAERHLVDVHREEVAWLLYKACQRGVLDKKCSTLGVHRWISKNESVHALSENELRGQAERIQRTPPSNALDRRAEVFQRSQSLEFDFHAPDLRRLAHDSLALVPRDETRLILAMALIQEDSFAEALHSLRWVLGNHPRAFNSYAAHADCALICWRCQSLEPAIAHYRRANRVNPETAIPLCYMLSLAIELQNEQLASKTAEMLADLGTPSGEMVGECIEFTQLQLQPCSSSTLSARKAIARRIIEDHPHSAGRIARVYV